MTKIKNYPLTQHQFELVTSANNWEKEPIPNEHWTEIPGIQRLEDTLEMVASGSNDYPQQSHGKSVVAGLDHLVVERHPKLDQNEPEGNAYHWIFQKTSNSEYPYVMYGPYKKGMGVPHWFEVGDLDVYFEDE